MAMQLDLDSCFRALADGTRRSIVEILQCEGELPAGRIVERFGSAQPTISKHLKVLERAGLVERRAEGRHHFFSLRPDALEPVAGWLARHRRLWNAAMDQLAGILDGDSP